MSDTRTIIGMLRLRDGVDLMEHEIWIVRKQKREKKEFVSFYNQFLLRMYEPRIVCDSNSPYRDQVDERVASFCHLV